MKKLVLEGAAALACAVVLHHQVADAATHFSIQAPGPRLVRSSLSSQPVICVVQGNNGSISAGSSANPPPFPCNVGVQIDAFVDVPWAPNPGGNETVRWQGVQPSGTTLQGRVLTYTSGGTLFSASAWVSGGGLKSASTPATGDGVTIIQFRITPSGSVTPSVLWVAPLVNSQ